MRVSATQLPTLSELKEILGKEAQRSPALGKEHLHFPNFDLVKELYTKYNADGSFFDESFNLQTLDEKMIDDVEENLTTVVTSVLRNQKDAIYDKIYDYLSEQDAPEKADLIFVFGSASNYRIDKAIELFKQGSAGKIVISGKGPVYQEIKQTEAEKFSLYAIENGVPEESVITEDNSISIPDNVKTSLNLLDEKQISYSKILLVNSPFAQRRGWAHFSKYTNAKIIRINSFSGEKYQKEHWTEQEDTVRIFLNEFLKMKLGAALNTA